MHASCVSPWHSLAKHCVLDTCFLLTVLFRGMLLTPQDGLQCLAPTAHQIPVYLMVFSTFLCRAFTAHHPEHIALTALAQVVAKPRMATQFIVTRDPAVRHLLTPRVEHLHALLLSPLITDFWWHVACLASLLVSGPLLGWSCTSGLRIMFRDCFQSGCGVSISRSSALGTCFQDLILPAWPTSAHTSAVQRRDHQPHHLAPLRRPSASGAMAAL